MSEPSNQSDRSLSRGITFMIVLTVIQRMVGMARQVMFCGFLSEEELGRWSIAFNFLILAAPLAVFGIPGSFGRYVEHYRTKNQLRSYLRQAFVGFLIPSSLVVAVVLMNSSWFSWLLFNDRSHASFVIGVAVALALLIVFNSLAELLMAMRLMHASTITQFVNSFVFTGLALFFLVTTKCHERGLIAVFIASTIIAIVVGAIPILRALNEQSSSAVEIGRSSMWNRVLPYAGWVWLGNLAANLFEVTDQFLIKHWTGVSPEIADAMLGQYYTSRVVPNVMNSVSVLLGGSLLPYLVSDWERGRRDQVALRLNSWMKAMAVSFTLGGAVATWLAPPLFSWAFRGKFDTGASLLPYTLAASVWFSLAIIGQRCLACAERSILTTATLCVSLGVNVVANLALLPTLGLKGAAVAFFLGHGADLVMTFVFNRQFGVKPDLGVWVAAMLPFSICLGPQIAIPITILFILTALTASSTFLTNRERDGLLKLLRIHSSPAISAIPAREA